jgi:lipopolysaccharide biosynthesis glycosyltransferase
MKSIDPIFNLKSPAILTYYTGVPRLNELVTNKPADVLSKCKEMGRVNGGVMLINPSMKLFEMYKSKIPEIVQGECKYPNETLFEYVNNSYYNLPIQYNLSHFLAKPFKLREYGLTSNDIIVYHFNETKYKQK